MSKLVSVVMPVYNAARFVESAITSLINQTYTNWELIAVDDGSTDNSHSILQSFDDKRIKVIRKPNGGQCDATNAGLDHITGDYVLFFDSDDLMDKHKIEEQVKILRDHPNCVSVGRWEFFRNEIPKNLCDQRPIYLTAPPSEWLYNLWTNDTMMPNHGYLIPTNIINRAGKYYDTDILLNVDFEYFTRIVMASKSVIYCKESICYYRKEIKTSKTYGATSVEQLSALNAREKAIQHFLKTNNQERDRYAARMAITILTYSYPSIRSEAKAVLSRMALGGFEKFGGRRFRNLSNLIGFENATLIKSVLDKIKT